MCETAVRSAALCHSLAALVKEMSKNTKKRGSARESDDESNDDESDNEAGNTNRAPERRGKLSAS